MPELRQASNQEILQELKERIERQKSSEKEAKVISLKIQEEKLSAQLDDGREVIVPISLLIKNEIISAEIKTKQLEKYELWGEGKVIFFPEADEVLPTWIIAKGLNSC